MKREIGRKKEGKKEKGGWEEGNWSKNVIRFYCHVGVRYQDAGRGQQFAAQQVERTRGAQEVAELTCTISGVTEPLKSSVKVISW